MNDPVKTPAKARRPRKSLAATLKKKKVRLQKYEAQKRSLARRLDTRKKIIAGALALEHIQYDGRYGQAFRALIDEYVTSDQDRQLFGLEPLPDGDERRVNRPKIY
jgi:hypothetical protein